MTLSIYLISRARIYLLPWLISLRHDVFMDLFILYNKIRFFRLLLCSLIIAYFFVIPVKNNFNIYSAQASSFLSGRILLQVEDKGQAWYVNPLNGSRYYLGRPDDAFNLMRALGLGVSNTDLISFQSRLAPARLSGRILLQVQDKGQAFYVSPLDLKLYYLGRPQDAFNLMRAQALGISNADLARIPIYAGSGDGQTNPQSSFRAVNFSFKYQNLPQNLNYNLAHSWYTHYSNAPKVYTYPASSPPSNPREAFYGMFLNFASGDDSIKGLATELRQAAVQNSWSDNELLEFTLALIQFIPYDHDKLSQNSNRNTNPYYPFETLYLNRGVCSDTSFLAVALLRELGYGAAILDFPDSNHSAVGVACPTDDAIGNSGYCYAETTNYFPVGVVPPSVSGGQAQIGSVFSVSFDASSLGKMEIYQKTSGKIYTGLNKTREKVALLMNLQHELSLLQSAIQDAETAQKSKENTLKLTRDQLDAYYQQGNFSAYNALVPEYNRLVSEYNEALNSYRDLLNRYNQTVLDLNSGINAFYQK